MPKCMFFFEASVQIDPLKLDAGLCDFGIQKDLLAVGKYAVCVVLCVVLCCVVCCVGKSFSL